MCEVCIPSDEIHLLTSFFRCTAPANNLDAHQHMHHSQEHTELLVEAFELGTLWDEYGLVGDIVVSVLPLCLSKSNIQAHSPEQISMSFWPPTSYIS